MFRTGNYWTFDVSALMVLIGEAEELNYRLMQRSLLECLTPCPVAGLQCYLRSYEWLQQHSNLRYFSPFGCKSAPLRNMRLANAILQESLLKDGRVTVYHITAPSSNRIRKPCEILLVVWFALCWIVFSGILTFLFQAPSVTWISKTNCICISLWSIILRLVEYHHVKLREDTLTVSKHTDADAIYILGRHEACFVLEGSRGDIKRWTASGFYFKGTTGKDTRFQNRIAALLQVFLRVGSFLTLLLVFVTIPNGTTMDQVMFIILNIIGQLNVLLGQRINAKCLFNSLENVTTISMESRTAVYAFLLRRFSVGGAGVDWASTAGLLPETEIWRRWGKKIIEDKKIAPKELYNLIVAEFSTEHCLNPVPECQQSDDTEISSTESDLTP